MRNIFFLVFFISFISCKKIVEPVARADYYITNNRSNDLSIQANIYDNRSLENSQIAAGTSVFIFKATEGSGGHIMPSNFFSSFKVYEKLQGGDSLIYEGVRNEDWIREPLSSDYFKVTLVINN